nr:PREDICTED: uncharacterized protein LOC109043223 [Bemisia tabaci]
MCLKKRMKHKDVGEILNVLRSDRNYLGMVPKDSRTFLGTSHKKVNFRLVDSGKYTHLSLREGLKLYIQETLKNTKDLENVKCIRIYISCDGLPIGKRHIWPILCGVDIYNDTKYMYVFPVGVYEGKKNPVSANAFLADLTAELKDLVTNGIQEGDDHFEVKIKVFMADAPGRALMQGIKSHSGYRSCPRCKIVGTPVTPPSDESEQDGLKLLRGRTSKARIQPRPSTRPNQKAKGQQGQENEPKKKKKRDVICFLETDPQEPRTNEEAASPAVREADLAKRDPKLRHFMQRTPLADIPGVKLVSQFPIDYMHAVLLGVVRTMVSSWITPKTRDALGISPSAEGIINCALENIAEKGTPFNNAPSELKDNWKATMSRQFLLYSGPVVLKNTLPDYIYNNFMLLSSAMRIALSPSLCKTHVPTMRRHLSQFVKGYKVIYGDHKMSFNIHSLLHLADDVEMYGCLDNVSSFNFEDFLGHIKRTVLHGATHPAAQLSKRNSEAKKNSVIFLKQRQKKTYLLKRQDKKNFCLNGKEWQQFKECMIDGVKMSTSSPNNIFGLTTGDIISISNILLTITSDGDMKIMLVGKKFVDASPSNFFFNDTIDEAIFGMMSVSKLGEEEIWPITDVSQKYCLLPYAHRQMAIPMLHTT